MHISSSYAKILGEKLFRTWEIPRSGSKAKNGEREKRKKERKRERERERLNNGENNGQATHGARKPPGPKPPEYVSKRTNCKPNYETSRAELGYQFNV